MRASPLLLLALLACDVKPNEHAVARPSMFAAAALSAKPDSSVMDSVTLEVRVPRVTRYFTRVDTLPSTPPAPDTTVTPPPPPPPPPPVGKRGIVFAPYAVDGLPMAPFTGTMAGYTPGNIVARVKAAQAAHSHLFVALTGGAHAKYKTNGKFDFTKWKQGVDEYATPTIRPTIQSAIDDGTIIAASVMDEPQQEGTDDKAWGPHGLMTKALVDQMCGYVKAKFPGIAAGPVHDAGVFYPADIYSTCDLTLSQYRSSKGPVGAFIAEGQAFAKRSKIAIAFSLNVIHGGAASKTCKKYGSDNAAGTLCPTTPDQVVEYGVPLGLASCAFTLWEHNDAMWADSRYQAAFRKVADTLAKALAKSCRRS